MYVSRSQQVADRCALALPQVNRIILGKLLQGFGFDVSYSANGQEAVQRFLRCPDISCILMVRLVVPHELIGPLSYSVTFFSCFSAISAIHAFFLPRYAYLLCV